MAATVSHNQSVSLQRPKFLPQIELEKIVRHETQTRNQKYSQI